METAIRPEAVTLNKGRAVAKSLWVPGIRIPKSHLTGVGESPLEADIAKKPERYRAPTSFVTHVRLPRACTQRARARDLCGKPRVGLWQYCLSRRREICWSLLPAPLMWSFRNPPRVAGRTFAWRSDP